MSKTLRRSKAIRNATRLPLLALNLVAYEQPWQFQC